MVRPLDDNQGPSALMVMTLASCAKWPLTAKTLLGEREEALGSTGVGLLLVESGWRDSSWAASAQLRSQQNAPVSRLTTDTLAWGCSRQSFGDISHLAKNM